MDFFSSIVGQYLVQITIHSLVIAVVAEAMIAIWRVGKPFLQIELRLLALSLPLPFLVLYHVLYPARFGAGFRQHTALMDSSLWLQLQLGHVAVWHLFLAILLLTSVFFLASEVVPSIGQYRRRRHALAPVPAGAFPKLDSALARLARSADCRPLRILLSDEVTPVAYTVHGRGLVLSAATIDLLDEEEIEAVIAHELAHHSGQAAKIELAALALRFLMFYNPFALLVFRRIVNENEKICDDRAVSLTGKDLALASGLLKVFRHASAGFSTSVPGRWRRRLWPPIAALEHEACRELVRSRAERMVARGEVSSVSHPTLRVVLLASFLLALLFFVV